MPAIRTPSLFVMLEIVVATAMLSQPASGENRSRWLDEREAGPFVCHADFSLAPRTELLHEINRLQDDLVRMLEIEPAREAVHLFWFEQKATYDRYLQVYFPEVPKRRALYIKARGPGMVFAHVSKDFDVDVRHESTHALLHASLPMVPLWLDEGLAEYFEVASPDRAAAHPHLRKIVWRLRLGRSSGIEQLEELADLSQMTQSHYQQAWAWVHFMLHGPPEAADELRRYLSDIGARTPPGKLSQRLRRRIPDLDAAFRQHFLEL